MDHHTGTRVSPHLISQWCPRNVARTPQASEVRLQLLVGDDVVAVGLVHDDPHSGTLAGYPVLLTATSCNFGGRRWWFVCPSQECGRRCRILYRPLGAARFACQECHRLTYKCRKRHRDRLFHFWRGMDTLDEAMREPWRSAFDPQLRARVDRAERAFKAMAPHPAPPSEESET